MLKKNNPISYALSYKNLCSIIHFLFLLFVFISLSPESWRSSMHHGASRHPSSRPSSSVTPTRRRHGRSKVALRRPCLGRFANMWRRCFCLMIASCCSNWPWIASGFSSLRWMRTPLSMPYAHPSSR